MKWQYDKGCNYRQWHADFGPHRWVIYSINIFSYRLWCYGVVSKDFFTLRGAMRGALEEAVEYCLYKIRNLEEESK